MHTPKVDIRASRKHESTKTMLINGQKVEVKVYPTITSDVHKKRANAKLKALRDLDDLFKEK